MFKSFFKKFKKDSSGKSSRDPICGMHASGGITLSYKGQTYVFCSNHCRGQFEKGPESYIKK